MNVFIDSSHTPVHKSGPTQPFLYLWIDMGTWIEEHKCFKKYLGVHNGTKGYAYTGSGADFKLAYKQRPGDFRRIIIMHDDYEFVCQQEEAILRAVAADTSTAWYNIQIGSWPLQHTDETKAKMRAAKRFVSDEARAKMSAAKKGKAPWNKGKTGQVAWNKGKTGIYSEETIAKLRDANLGKTYSAETRAKVSAAGKGKKRSAETRARMSEAAQNRTAEHCAKISEAHKRLYAQKQTKGPPKEPF